MDPAVSVDPAVSEDPTTCWDPKISWILMTGWKNNKHLFRNCADVSIKVNMPYKRGLRQ